MGMRWVSMVTSMRDPIHCRARRSSTGSAAASKLSRSIQANGRAGVAPPGTASRSTTPDLLVEEGSLYDSTLQGDEVPYILETKKGSLVELPSHMGLDDWTFYAYIGDFNHLMQIMTPDRAMEVYMADFEALRQCGVELCRFRRMEC
jgi:hypothetical protein